MFQSLQILPPSPANKEQSRRRDRGVRADFCDYCQLITRHYVCSIEDSTSVRGVDLTSRTISLEQHCEICRAVSAIDRHAVRVPAAEAATWDIQRLVTATNRELTSDESTEAIVESISSTSNSSRRLAMFNSFAYFANDVLTELRNHRWRLYWALVAKSFVVGFLGIKFLGFWLGLLPVIALISIFWLVIQSSSRRSIREQIWVRLVYFLSGTGVQLSELVEFVHARHASLVLIARELDFLKRQQELQTGSAFWNRHSLKPRRDFFQLNIPS
jgi:hypothetical protein